VVIKKTTPLDGYENLQFAVVSCSNYQAGYYNAFGRIAERDNLNAVIHLGDYIYEGTERPFDKENKLPFDEFEATHFVMNKEWWLHYYRKRYGLKSMHSLLYGTITKFVTVLIKMEPTGTTHTQMAIGRLGKMPRSKHTQSGYRYEVMLQKSIALSNTVN
jgi:hypothetical protein